MLYNYFEELWLHPTTPISSKEYHLIKGVTQISTMFKVLQDCVFFALAALLAFEDTHHTLVLCRNIT